MYAAFRAFPRPVSHRELIHLAVILKESGLVTGVEHVSKTKVRGVLAILKQGELVTKSSSSMGDAVQLYLTEDINSFERLRERHDHFLVSYMMENMLNIPEGLYGEIVWRVSGGRKQQRLELLEYLVSQLMPVAVAEVSRMGDQYSGGWGDGDGEGEWEGDRVLPPTNRESYGAGEYEYEGRFDSRYEEVLEDNNQFSDKLYSQKFDNDEMNTASKDEPFDSMQRILPM